MVGRKQDLPLVEKGHDQARQLGRQLQVNKIVISKIVAAPLKRTREFAELVRAEAAATVAIESNEVWSEFDYGAWSGLTDAQIRNSFGDEEIDLWNTRSEWPTVVSFSPPRDQAIQDVERALEELTAVTGIVLVVTSNGRLRIAGQILHSRIATFESSNGYKVRTGHTCVVIKHANVWRVIGWDLAPENVEPAIARSGYPFAEW